MQLWFYLDQDGSRNFLELLATRSDASDAEPEELRHLLDAKLLLLLYLLLSVEEWELAIQAGLKAVLQQPGELVVTSPVPPLTLFWILLLGLSATYMSC